MSRTFDSKKLLEKYESGFRQSDECTCGPASISLVAYAIDGKKRDEAEWLNPKFKRWVPVDEFRTRGIGLVELLFTSELVLGGTFEVLLRRAHPENRSLLVKDLDSFLRGEAALIPNFRQDDLLGIDRDDHKNPHYSPIAQYDPKTATVLIADVDSEIKKPYTVSVEKLFESMAEINPVFDLPRGWLVIRKRE